MRTDAVIALAKGAATYIPGLYPLLRQRRMTAEGVTAEYSYGVWTKHLARFHKLTGKATPAVVAELGPGDTLGCGVAALLGGAKTYIGADVLSFAKGGRTGAMVPEIAALFRSRLALDGAGFPYFRDVLDESGFLSSVYSDDVLSEALEPARVAAIGSEAAAAVDGTSNGGASMKYVVPYSRDSVAAGSVDFLFSHSVLEHAVDLGAEMRAVRAWMKPGAIMSHQFDQRSHELTRDWDGHRRFEDAAWKLVVGKRPFLINRLTFSEVVQRIEDAGFRILTAERELTAPTLDRSELCRKWRAQSDEELATVSGFVQAEKI